MIQITADNFEKCSNIWDIRLYKELSDRFLTEIASKNRIAFAYEINGDFVGEGALVFDMRDSDYTIPNSRIYLSHLVVKENFRKKGIGTEIVDFLFEKAKLLGYLEISVGVDKENSGAVKFYRRLGFVKLGEFRDANGLYFKMIKML
jgi:ribosomal protein S18 acetylase RimI-like enzyme